MSSTIFVITNIQLLSKNYIWWSDILLQVSVRELHNRLVGDLNYIGLQEARDEENSIIISDSTLR